MKITNSAGRPAKSASETVCPSTFGSEKSGALVPKDNIVLGVNTMGLSPSCKLPMPVIVANSGLVGEDR
jgi:hypothetical protein